MESFIYYDLNKASRDRNVNSIKYFGPFAAALSYILYYANSRMDNQLQLNGQNTLYRGVKLTDSELEAYQVGSRVHLRGYTSSSKQEDVAKVFACSELSSTQRPVVFKITFYGNYGLLELSNESSAFKDENEVLLQDGLEYLVTQVRNINAKEGEMEYLVVELQYPADRRWTNFFQNKLCDDSLNI